MRRRVRPEEPFYDSLAALDDSDETIQTYTMLLREVVARPERGRIVTGMTAWVLKQPAHGRFLPMRIFYWFDDETVHLLDVDHGPVS